MIEVRYKAYIYENRHYSIQKEKAATIEEAREIKKKIERAISIYKDGSVIDEDSEIYAEIQAELGFGVADAFFVGPVKIFEVTEKEIE